MTARTRSVSTGDVAAHPAVLAWMALDPMSEAPQAVETLKEVRGRPTGVYRLSGLPSRGSVIAKRCSLDDAAHERLLYEQVLPHLPLSTVRYYGSVGDATHPAGWLFLEDAGNEPYSPLVTSHRTLAAEWLGVLHSRGDMARTIPLPDRGVQWYRTRLQSARELLDAGLRSGSMDARDASRLQRVAAWCDAVDARWVERTAAAEGMPCTLVHADFVGENVRVRARSEGLVLLPFDWGISGWGPPARDLVGVDIRRYHATVQHLWPEVSETDLRRLAVLGRLFRRIAAVHRACMSLPYAPVQKVLSDMQFLAVRA